MNNAQTDALLQARADKTINDILGLAGNASGVAGIGYGLAGKLAPPMLSLTDDFINLLQVLNAARQDGAKGFITTTIGWGFTKSVGEAANQADINNALAPILELGAQVAYPKAAEILVERQSDEK